MISARQTRTGGGAQNVDLSLPPSICWENKTENTANLKIASDNANIIYSSSFNKIEYADGDGERLWSSDLGGEVCSNLSVIDKGVYLVLKFNESYYLRSISRITGLIVWQTKLEAVSAAEIVENGNEAADGDEFEVYPHFTGDKIIVSARSGDLYAFQTENGGEIWHARGVGNLTSKSAYDKDKIFVAAGGKLKVFSAVDGKLLREFSADVYITSLAVDGSDVIFYGDKNGGVASVNFAVGAKVRQVRVGSAQISDVTPTPGGVLVSSLDNFVYLLSAKNGKRLWKRRLSGRIAFRPAVFGDYAIISVLFDSSAVIIRLKDGKIVNRISVGTDNFFAGEILSADNRIIVPTLHGLKSYAFSPGKCL